MTTLPSLELHNDPRSALGLSTRFDGVIVVSGSQDLSLYPALAAPVEQARKLDRDLEQQVSLIAATQLAGGRLVYAPTGPLDRAVDDVRRFAEAAAAGFERGCGRAGMRSPLLLVHGIPDDPRYRHAADAALLGALEALHRPTAGGTDPDGGTRAGIERLGITVKGGAVDTEWVKAVEQGRLLARELTLGDPEAMAPPAFAEHCLRAFADTGVQHELIADPAVLEREYPLLMAVARASRHVGRHQPRVLRLIYTGPGSVRRTLLVAGKGVTYDTGGANIKINGVMAGMSKDKGGAASAAGFVRAAAAARTPGLRVVAELGLVRNSVGAEGYVADEILTSHAGVRVKVSDTDAEGRLVLADLLSHLRVAAAKETAPHLFSIATLTGHVALAYGAYTAVLDNGPAAARQMAAQLVAAGDAVGDPAEVSRLRREDFEFLRPKDGRYQVLSSNTQPSSRTPRGHQFPFAFLGQASGLCDGEGRDGALPYTHLDIGGSAVRGGDWLHGLPSAATVGLLAQAFLRP